MQRRAVKTTGWLRSLKLTATRTCVRDLKSGNFRSSAQRALHDAGRQEEGNGSTAWRGPRVGHCSLLVRTKVR
jgi:hypothetical protein